MRLIRAVQLIFSLALLLMLIGCGDGASSGGAAGSNLEACDPGESRTCDCEIGTGTQSCQSDESWAACLCPIKEAKLLSEAQLVSIQDPDAVEVSENSIVLPADGNEHLLDIAPGTVIVSFDGAGLLTRVVASRRDGNDVHMDTAPAKISDAFEKLRVDLNTPLNLHGNLPSDARGQLYQTQDYNPFQPPSLSRGFASFSGTGSAGVGFEIDPASNFSLDGGIIFDLDYGLFTGLDELRAVGYVSADTTLITTTSLSGAFSVTGEVELIEAALTATGYGHLAPLSFPIAGGFEGQVFLFLGCTIDASAAASFTTRFDGSVAIHGGIEWDDENDEFDTVSSLTKSFDAEVTDFDFELGAGLKCWIKPRLALVFLRTASVHVTGGPYAETRVQIQAGANTLDVNAGIEVDVGASIEIDLEAFTLELLSASWPLYRNQWNLFHHEFAICGDGFTQLDEECDPKIPFASRPYGETCEAPLGTNPCECAEGFTNVLGVYTRTTGVDDGRWGTNSNMCVPACGNGVVDPGEACDEGYYNGGCGPSACADDCSHVIGTWGDGYVDTQCGFLCDDGNQDDCDDCVYPGFQINGGCGDGIIQWQCGETCDDGNTLNGDLCPSDCVGSEFCGDGIRGPGEACDDGNQDHCDMCSIGCGIAGPPSCGDGRLCGSEECDYLGPSTPWCDPDCTMNECGDGYVGIYEECDDGGVSTSTCDFDCTLPACGDGRHNPAFGEECDSGGQDSYTCDADCTLVECGDGHRNTVMETCDDGDQDDCTTACNQWCTGPTFGGACGDGIVAGGCETCDDGTLNGECGQCASDCSGLQRYCGDGNVDTACGEVCDDGNTDSGDGCRGDCRGTETCGDSLVDVNETCDDGQPAPCAGPCNETCTAFYPDVCGDQMVTGCEVCEDTQPAPGIDAGCTATAPNCAGCGRCSADICGDGIIGSSENYERTGQCESPETGSCTLIDLSQCDTNARCFLLMGEGTTEPTCQRKQTCGDGFIDGSETCEPPNVGNCNVSCLLNP